MCGWGDSGAYMGGVTVGRVEIRWQTNQIYKAATHVSAKRSLLNQKPNHLYRSLLCKRHCRPTVLAGTDFKLKVCLVYPPGVWCMQNPLGDTWRFKVGLGYVR